MFNYDIELLRHDGHRNCLFSILCAKDRSAIRLAGTIFRLNRSRAARVVVWRGDELIFETPGVSRLN